MKKQILLFITIGILLSCNSDNEDSNLETEITGNWKLIQMTGSIPNSVTTGSEMEYQETYTLNTDGTFQKSRNTNGILLEASGIYNSFDLPDGKYLEFIFDNESKIIGSCNSSIKERVFFQSENIFLSTWENCDGPGLKYEKAKSTNVAE